MTLSTAEVIDVPTIMSTVKVIRFEDLKNHAPG